MASADRPRTRDSVGDDAVLWADRRRGCEAAHGLADTRAPDRRPRQRPTTELTSRASWWPGRLIRPFVDGSPGRCYDRVFPERHTSGPVAQLGARLNGIQEVTGSIPVRSTILRSPFGRATDGKPASYLSPAKDVHHSGSALASAATVDRQATASFTSKQSRGRICAPRRPPGSPTLAYSFERPTQKPKQSARNQTCSRAAYVGAEVLRLCPPELR